MLSLLGSAILKELQILHHLWSVYYWCFRKIYFLHFFKNLLIFFKGKIGCNLLVYVAELRVVNEKKVWIDATVFILQTSRFLECKGKWFLTIKLKMSIDRSRFLSFWITFECFYNLDWFQSKFKKHLHFHYVCKLQI